MRYYIVAGEHSGDVHGADLIDQIKKLDPSADFWCCGGVTMQKAVGKPCRVHTMAYMGLDFLKKGYQLWSLLQFCKKALQSYQPDLLILIDYSGFNMRLALFAKKHGFLVYYYIPPKIWAHGQQRIAQIKQAVDHIFSLLPFEATYYREQGYAAIDYVGNPLVQKVGNHIIHPDFRAANGLDQSPIIALLPGSRVDEIQRILPIILQQVAYFPSYQFVIGGLSHIPCMHYRRIASSSVKIVYDQTYDLLAVAEAGIIASGTASLEAALFNLPQIVVYKTHPLTYFIYKKRIKVAYISLVNLLVDQPVVPELIQYTLTSERLYTTLAALLADKGNSLQRVAYRQIAQLLGKQNAPLEVAKMIVARSAKGRCGHSL